EAELSELVRPSEVMLGPTELVRFGCVVTPSLRAVRPSDPSVGRGPALGSESGVTIDETGIPEDHDVSGVSRRFSHKGDTTAGMFEGLLTDPLGSHPSLAEAAA